MHFDIGDFLPLGKISTYTFTLNVKLWYIDYQNMLLPH